MTVNHPITVDLVQPGLTPRIYAMQHDANSRVILFTLTQAGTPWEAPEGAIFGLSYRKTDGTRGYYTEHIVRSDATVSVTVAPQVLTCPGTVDAALVCNAADGSRIAAFPLQIQVRPDPAAGKTDSDDYFNPSDALRYTPQQLTEAQKQQARANLGLETAASDTWLYNGNALPPLPDWDKETYPYALISLRRSIGTYYLSVHKAIHYHEAPSLVGTKTYFGDDTPGTALLYTWQEGQTAWALFDKDFWSICVDRDDTVKDIALWANFNLLYADEEMYVAASEPVTTESESGGSYILDLDEMGISEAILGLFSSNGGRIELDESVNWQPWEVLNVKKPVTVHFTLAPLYTEIYTANTTVFFYTTEGKAHGLGFDVVVGYNGDFFCVSVSVQRNLHWDGTGTYYNQGVLYVSVRGL